MPAVSPLTPWIWPESPWQRIHIDFAELDKQHYLVVVDAHSKWPEIFPMNSTNASATMAVMNSLSGRYGSPAQVVSDNGPPFSSSEFEFFLRSWGVKPVRVAPYQPFSNGLAERMVQAFKYGLNASKNSMKSLKLRLKDFLNSNRSTPHATTGCTQAKSF